MRQSQDDLALPRRLRAKQREVSHEEGGFLRDRCAITIQLLKIHGEDGVRADFAVGWEPDPLSQARANF